jgi:hypothetical protein
MDGNRSQNASDRKGLLSFGCILEQLELLEMLESHIAASVPISEAARDLAALSKDRLLEPLACPNWAYKATPGDSRSRPTRLAWRASSPRVF